jgi:hypothetical protein
MQDKVLLIPFYGVTITNILNGVFNDESFNSSKVQKKKKYIYKNMFVFLYFFNLKFNFTNEKKNIKKSTRYSKFNSKHYSSINFNCNGSITFVNIF